MIRAFPLLALGLLAATAARGATIGPFDGVLSPTPPRAGDALQLDLSNPGSCAMPLPAAIDVQRAGAELEVRVGSGDACSTATPSQSRAYAIGVVEPGVERIVVFSCGGNPPPGAPRCTAAFSVATAGAIAGQAAQPVSATAPIGLALLATVTLLAGLGATRRSASP